ncbi:hypothetical protein BN2537_831 [Streptomyces venezuelae]|nr:hypothetical protein BN2537_831 [Streptomyces venezuelae]
MSPLREGRHVHSSLFRPPPDAGRGVRDEGAARRGTFCGDPASVLSSAGIGARGASTK